MRSRKPLGVLSLVLLGLGLYQLRRQFVARWLGLRPVRFGVTVQRNLDVPTPDGVNLVTDHYMPKGDRMFPTVLIRTPYGRGKSAGLVGLLPTFVAQRFAERGYNVLVQDVRGRFDSQGEFEPFVHEADDGRATFEWIERQPWFNGVLGMWGQSYVGYVQWAVAPGAPLYLKAMLPSISGSRLPLLGLRDRVLELDTLLRWIMQLDIMEHRGKLAGLLSLLRFTPRMQDRVIARAADHLPIAQGDQATVGKEIPFYQKWLANTDPQDEYWRSVDRSPVVGQVTAAVHLVAGWFDILLRETLDDYAALRANRQQPYLTIGPWAHMDAECMWETLRQGLIWFDANLKGDRQHLRNKAVCIYVMGSGEWREMESWPPPANDLGYYLVGAQDEKADPAGILTLREPPEESAPTRYVYDPSDPTPAVGGPLMNFSAGSRDNRSLEARPDVLTFTSASLDRDMEIMGPVRVVVYVRSSLESTDFFARLCDVYPDGRSMNICDGKIRLEPGGGLPQPDGSLRLELDLGATAYCFLDQHRVRLQISSGAHPRWDRNLGTGEPLTSGTQMASADQTIYHDRTHPSVLHLPATRV